MSDLESIRSAIADYVINSLKTNETAAKRLERISNQLDSLPNIANKTTLQDLIDGKYKVSLKEYTSLNSYRNVMDSLYGNKSSNTFKNTINKILGRDDEDDKLASAKDFVEKMKEYGYSNSSAIKLYKTLESYSLVSAFQSNKTNSYVSVKV